MVYLPFLERFTAEIRCYCYSIDNYQFMLEKNSSILTYCSALSNHTLKMQISNLLVLEIILHVAYSIVERFH